MVELLPDACCQSSCNSGVSFDFSVVVFLACCFVTCQWKFFVRVLVIVCMRS